MDKAEAIKLVKQYKEIIMPRFNNEAQVYMFGDIDVAVVVPTIGDNWFAYTKSLWHDVDKVSLLIEPVLVEKSHPSPLYDDIMRTGIAI